jgi:hypothetical protein
MIYCNISAILVAIIKLGVLIIMYLHHKEELHIITHKPELNSQHATAYKRKQNKDMFKSNTKPLNYITEQLERLHVHYYQHTSRI